MQAVAVARRIHPAVAPLAVGAAAAGVCAAVALNDPSNSFLPVCTFRSITGLPCPGCGATRAAYQLMHGNVGAALEFNALAVLVIFPLMIGYYLAWAVPRLGGPEFVKLRVPVWLVSSMGVLVFAWWGLRMLPFEPFIGLRV